MTFSEMVESVADRVEWRNAECSESPQGPIVLWTYEGFRLAQQSPVLYAVGDWARMGGGEWYGVSAWHSWGEDNGSLTIDHWAPLTEVVQAILERGERWRDTLGEVEE